MRITFSGILVLFLIILLVDGLFFVKYLKKKKTTKKKLSPFALFWYAVIPLFFSAIILYFFFAIPNTTNFAIYNQFGWFMMVVLTLYSFKITILLIRGLKRLLQSFKKEKVSDFIAIPNPTISRKKFVSQLGIIFASAPFAGLIVGLFHNRFSFFKRYVKLSFTNLPNSFEGLRIIQISDIHLGCFQGNKDAFAEAVALINSEHPDIVVFTGDLVNNFFQETVGWEDLFLKINASFGKYSILGNHDYGEYSNWKSIEDKQYNFQEIRAAHKRFGFRLLENENIPIIRNGEIINLAGVEYWGKSAHLTNYGDLKKASLGVSPASFNILLSHDPDHWDAEVLPQGVYDLTLSGHTHGMQFGISYKGFKWSPASFKFKYWDGLYRNDGRFLYVNRGLGVLGMPARVGMAPEITIIDLTRGPFSNEPM